MNNSYIINELHCRDHYFNVPLDYQLPNDKQLSIFVREVASEEGLAKQLPYLVYLQGGPGFGAGRPSGLDGWIKEAAKNYRILLLDQRGTAKSSPINAQTLRYFDGQQQADYLSLFRADNIVRDAECIRQQLIGDGKWSIIGQSFGGFCVLRYLSAASIGLKQAFITGGIPSLTRRAEDVYKATFKRVQDKNKLFFAKFPHAQQMAKDVADYLLNDSVQLPNGTLLTVESFQLLGIHLGMTGGHEELFYMLEQAFVEVNGKAELSFVFKDSVSRMLDFDSNPIFAFLHESIYCQEFSSNWAAHRVRESDYAPQFDYAGQQQEFLFTGEMVFPWMFEQFVNLKPLQQAAELLAAKDDWPMLYDLDVLKNNTVPTAAAVYREDMYVDINYSLETAERVANLKTWITSDYDHNGIRIDGETIFSQLHGMLNG
ncbi:MAG: alpha/beta fold hydrolase [Psychrobium sp.]|nr:alpha/beta fold hydrolase [Psychrobium sp.]